MQVRRVTDSHYQPSALSSSNGSLAIGTGSAKTGTKTLGKMELDSENPIDAIRIRVSGTWTAVGTSPTYEAYGVLNIIPRIVLQRHNIIDELHKPNNIPVDVSGAGIVGWNDKVLQSLDRNTLLEVSRCAAGGNGGFANSDTFSVVYTIPFAHPCQVDPLQQQGLLPVHRDGEKPTLELTLAGSDDLNLVATGNITGIGIDVEVDYAEMPKSVEAAILSKGGYLMQEFREFTSNAEANKSDYKIQFPRPRQIAGIYMREFTAAATAGTMTTAGKLWELYNGKTQLLRKLIPAMVQAKQDQQGGTMKQDTANTLPNFAYDYWLNFLNPYGTDANDLGSLLDTDIGNLVETYLQFDNVANAFAKVFTHSYVSKDQCNYWRPFKLQ